MTQWFYCAYKLYFTTIKFLTVLSLFSKNSIPTCSSLPNELISSSLPAPPQPPHLVSAVVPIWNILKTGKSETRNIVQWSELQSWHMLKSNKFMVWSDSTVSKWGVCLACGDLGIPDGPLSTTRNNSWAQIQEHYLSSSWAKCGPEI